MKSGCLSSVSHWLTICTSSLSIRANNAAMDSHFNVVYYVKLSATARKFKMGEGGVQIDWCQIKNISHVFFSYISIILFFDNSFSKRKHFKNYLSDKFPTNYPSLFNLIELTFRCLSKQQVLAFTKCLVNAPNIYFVIFNKSWHRSLMIETQACKH